MERNPVRKQKYIFKERGFFNNEYQLIFIRLFFFFWFFFGLHLVGFSLILKIYVFLSNFNNTEFANHNTIWIISALFRLFENLKNVFHWE